MIERPDGTSLLRYGKQALTWREVGRRPAKTKAATKPIVNNRRWTPPADHPFWRGLGAVSRRPAAGTEGLTVLLRREPPTVLLR